MANVLLALITRLSTFHKLRESAVFQSFARVLIQDSTTIRLPDHLADSFPGSANKSRKKTSALKIQAVYDLLGETFHHFGLSGFRRTDQAASADILAVAKPGDLVLRDLGYFSSPVFQKLLDQGIHFVSRLRRNVSIIDPIALKKIDLLKRLRRDRWFDQPVLLGAEQRVRLRLVALPVPEQVANERRRKAKADRDKRLKPSKEDLELLGWSIFVTSVESSVWSAKMVEEVYGIRWRIEIIFKSWKSHFNLTSTPKGSELQLEVLILAKLFAICLFQRLFGCLELYILKPASLLKWAQFFPWLLIGSISSLAPNKLRIETILQHLKLEKRKRKDYHPQCILLA